MSKIPFEQQHLPRDRIQDIANEIKQGNAVSGTDLLSAIEHSMGPQLEARLRDIIRQSSIPDVKQRGRPHGSVTKIDFALEELDRRYPAQLQKEQEKDRDAKSGDAPASERAYRRLLADMNDDFGPIDWRALANKHSAWKNGHLHSIDDPVDSEDVDAEMDRQFPAPKS